jgi:hypothetical protein
MPSCSDVVVEQLSLGAIQKTSPARKHIIDLVHDPLCPLHGSSNQLVGLRATTRRSERAKQFWAGPEQKLPEKFVPPEMIDMNNLAALLEDMPPER